MRSFVPISTRLVYLDTDSEPPISIMSTQSDGTAQSRGQYTSIDVTVRNARQLQSPASVDREGFELCHLRSKCRNFYDEEQLRTTYYPEVAALLKKRTGASEVVVFDHNIRAEITAPKRPSVAHEPVHLVHNDFTEHSGPARVKRELGAHRAANLLTGRLAIINVWRPIVGAVMSKPLALCDAQSLSVHDLVAADMIYSNRTGSEYRSRYNPQHRWYYYPTLETEEVLLIKVCDSATDGRARFCLHSAFDDPSSPDGAAPRQSVELRVMLFF